MTSYKFHSWALTDVFPCFQIDPPRHLITAVASWGSTWSAPAISGVAWPSVTLIHAHVAHIWFLANNGGRGLPVPVPSIRDGARGRVAIVARLLRPDLTSGHVLRTARCRGRCNGGHMVDRLLGTASAALTAGAAHAACGITVAACRAATLLLRAATLLLRATTLIATHGAATLVIAWFTTAHHATVRSIRPASTSTTATE